MRHNATGQHGSADAATPAEETPAVPLTYSGYLHLPELLRLQRPRTDIADELLFIVAHQAIELWLKVIIGDIRQAIRCLDEDQWIDATVAVRRANCCSGLILEQTRSLRQLAPT